MAQALTIQALADALGRPKSSVHRMSKEDWFPERGPEGWNVEDVAAAIAGEGDPSPSRGAPEGARDELAVLEEAADPVEICRAAMRIASRRLAEGGGGRRSTASKKLEDLRETIAELGKTEARFLELRKAQGSLIEREVAKAVVGDAVARAIRVLERYEVQLAQRVEAWLADRAFAELPPDERARAVRAWAREQTYQVRSMTSDEVERLVAAEIKDRDAS